jgi:hypothetical protein
MVELSAGASVAVSLDAPPSPHPAERVRSKDKANTLIAWSNCWPRLHQRAERRPDAAAEIASPRRREGRRL